MTFDNVRPKSTSCVPDPFLLFGVGSGDEISFMIDLKVLYLTKYNV